MVHGSINWWIIPLYISIMYSKKIEIPEFRNLEVSQFQTFKSQNVIRFGKHVFQQFQDLWLSDFPKSYFVKMMWHFLFFPILLHKIREPTSNKWSRSENFKNAINSKNIINMFKYRLGINYRDMPIINRTVPNESPIFLWKRQLAEDYVNKKHSVLKLWRPSNLLTGRLSSC